MIIKEYAKILALKDKSTVSNYQTVLENLKNSRILLGFMENLEKAIYNASDGNAFGIPAPEKSARTFFRLNTSTCQEWFSRNRTAIDLIALHSMELEMVIRYSESVLKDLVVTGKSDEKIFDHILLSLVWALLRNFESDALMGVYSWTRIMTGRKYQWIKCVADQASGKKELAAEGYEKLLKEQDVDGHLRDFLEDQLSICLLYSAQYERMYERALSLEKSGPRQRVTIPIAGYTTEQARVCVEFDTTNDYSILPQMSCWEQLEEEPNVSSISSVHPLIFQSSGSLFDAITKESVVPEKVTKVISTLLTECLRSGSKEFLNILVFLNFLSRKTYERNIRTNDMKGVYINKKYGSYALLYVLFYSELFDQITTEGKQQSIDLRLDVISMARKETNFGLCQKELIRCYNKIEMAYEMGIASNQRFSDGLEACKNILTAQEAIENVDVWNENISRCVYEHSKFLYFTSQVSF
jgi:PI-3-kinase-related kinase SMG-1